MILRNYNYKKLHSHYKNGKNWNRNDKQVACNYNFYAHLLGRVGVIWFKLVVIIFGFTLFNVLFWALLSVYVHILNYKKLIL